MSKRKRGLHVDRFLAGREQIHEQRGEARVLKTFGDGAVARAMPAAAASVHEDDDRSGARRHGQIAVEGHGSETQTD